MVLVFVCACYFVCVLWLFDDWFCIIICAGIVIGYLISITLFVVLLITVLLGVLSCTFSVVNFVVDLGLIGVGGCLFCFAVACCDRWLIDCVCFMFC